MNSTLKAETEEHRVGNLVVNFCGSHVVTLSPDEVRQGRECVERVCHLFPEEDTWVQRELGLPTIIARIDGVVRDGELVCFEVEERPAAIGLAFKFNPDFRERFAQVRRSWPAVEVVASPNRIGWLDDHIWTEVTSIEDPRWAGGNGDGLFLFRCEPYEQGFHRLEDRSVSTLKREGDKTYGETMDWWRRVRSSDELPWDENFVLKPIQGSKCRAIEVWSNKGRANRPRGASTSGRIRRVLEEEKEMFLQPFVEPMQGPGGLRLILRFHYAFNLSSGCWEYLGGVWMARDNLKVHGTPDTVTGIVR